MNQASKTPLQKPIDIAKKQWTLPTVEIIATDNIESGHRTTLSEAALASQHFTIAKSFS